MAQLLGNRFCIESLQTDVTDLQEAVMDVFSRSGPVQATSWKYPDKISADLDITDLLESYGYCEDEEERQISHIVLLELVIDRLVLLLQAMSRYVDQMSFAAGCTPSKGSSGSVGGASKHTAVGLVVKRYWACMVQAFAHMCSMQRETKSKSRQITDLKDQVSCLESQLEAMKENIAQLNTTLGNCSVPLSGEHCGSGSVSKASGYSISRDESNKSCQTIETAFVPCESCLFVQKNLKETGKFCVGVCKSQGLPSSLEKYMSQMEKLDWMGSNDVKVWTCEQNKDINRINKHLEYLMSTIDPLKEELEGECKKNKEMKSRILNCEKEVRLEKDTQATQLRQFETKIRGLEKEKTESLNSAKRDYHSLVQEKTELVARLNKVKLDLEEQQKEYYKLTEAKTALEEGMDKRVANSQLVSSLKKDVESLQSKLATLTEKLTESDKELSREKAKLKSINKHSESMQSKQASLLERLNDLDLENDELRNQTGELEQEKEELHEALEHAQDKQRETEKAMEEQKVLVRALQEEKDSLEESLTELRSDVTELEGKLRGTQEEMRLLVEYPDLNGPVNPDYTGTGDLTLDMENQVKANAARIQLLEEQNSQLTRSITKLIQVRGGKSHSQYPNHDEGKAKPVPLWRPAQSTHDYQTSGSPNTGNGVQELLYHEEERHSVVSKRQGRRQVTEEETRPPSANTPRSARQETFVVGKSTKERVQSRPKSGNKAGRGGSHSSVGAYSRLKAAGLLQTQSGTTQPKSGKHGSAVRDMTSPMPEVFTCHKCDKIYNSRRDLDVHYSYCYGGI